MANPIEEALTEEMDPEEEARIFKPKARTMADEQAAASRSELRSDEEAQSYKDDMIRREIEAYGPNARFKGVRGGDIPTGKAVRTLDESPTDSMMQSFIDRFGFGALRRVPGMSGDDGAVPLPRPRAPHMDPNNPLGPLPIPYGAWQGNVYESDAMRDLPPEDIEYLKSKGLVIPGR